MHHFELKIVRKILWEPPDPTLIEKEDTRPQTSLQSVPTALQNSRAFGALLVPLPFQNPGSAPVYLSHRDTYWKGFLIFVDPQPARLHFTIDVAAPWLHRRRQNDHRYALSKRSSRRRRYRCRVVVEDRCVAPRWLRLSTHHLVGAGCRRRFGPANVCEDDVSTICLGTDRKTG